MARTRKYAYRKGAVSQTAAVAAALIVIVAVVAGAYLILNSRSPATSTPTSSTSPTISSQTTPTSATSQMSTTSSTGLPSTLPAESLSETGSTLLYPLFQIWAANFSLTYTNVHITTAGTGSGTGISDAETGTVQIGASDAYMTNAQITQYPDMLNIPLAISAQNIDYNIPGIPQSDHLNLSGPILAGIYNGSITYWDNAQIKAANPALANQLPHQTIIPIRRSDGSGDTFIFTQYLSFTTASWNSSVGYGTTVSWPSTPTLTAALGNGGMVEKCNATSYSVAYIGISYLNEALKDGLGYAYLKNQAGNYVAPTQVNIQAAANALVGKTPADERISLVFAPGADSYPIINYEYAIVSKTQSDSNMALVLRTLLTWAVTTGEQPYFLDQVHFIALPQSIVQLSIEQINEIS